MTFDSQDRDARIGRVPRLSRDVGVGLLAVAGAALAYVGARYALEVVLVLVAGAVLVLVQRTVADWLRDLFGASAVNLVLAALAVAGGWYLLGSDHGRHAVKETLAAADRRGFKTVWIDRSYVHVPGPRVSGSPSGGGSASPPRVSGGGSTVTPRASGGGSTAPTSGSGATRAASPQAPRQPSLVRTTSPGRLAGDPGPGGVSSGRLPSTSPTAPTGAATTAAPDGTTARAHAGSGSGAPQVATLRMHLLTDPPIAGEHVTIRVEAVSAPGDVRGGSIELSVNDVPLGSGTLDRWGRVDFTIQNLSAGSYSLTVRLRSDTWVGPRQVLALKVVEGE
jgi:hypothetical protein